MPDAEIAPAVAAFHPSQAAPLLVLLEAGGAWLATQSEPARAAAARRLAQAGARWLILPQGVTDTATDDFARAGLTRLRSSLPGPELLMQLRRELALIAASRVTLHGVFVEVCGLGVLLTGKSGIGKSELALELLQHGHRLIADDAAEFARVPPGYLIGRCPPLLQDFLEVRGLGILNARKTFSDGAIRDRQRLDLAIDLVDAAAAPVPEERYRERLEGRRGRREWLGVGVAEIQLPVAVGHNLATLVEAACRDWWQRLAGSRADEEFAARQQAAIARQ